MLKQMIPLLNTLAMYNESDKVDLIGRYLRNELSDEEKAQVEDLIQDEPDWAEELTFQRDLMTATITVKKREIKSWFQKIPFPLKSKSVKQKMQDAVDYTIEQLQQMFTPLPVYQAQLAVVSRASSITVVSPENGMNFEHDLYFELTKYSSDLVEVSIENNYGETILETEYPKGTKVFEIDLSNENLAPGRYYWKLFVEDDMVLREFFVQKELMEQIEM